MKAVQILGDISSPTVTTTTALPIPTPQDDEILLRVHAAGITAPELTWPEVYAHPSRIPGHDVAGTVHRLGSRYAGSLKVGDEAYGMLHAERGGGQAEYVACGEDEVVRRPVSLGVGEAAALPIPLLTAWEGLVTRGGGKAGMRVLVTGASGAVGWMVVQLATTLLEAHVIALASAHNHEPLRQLGASQVLDYNDPTWPDQAQDVDFVFDTVGGALLPQTWQTIQPAGGTLLTVGDPPPAWAFGRGPAPEAERFPRVRYEHFIVSPDAARLRMGAEMVEEGRLRALKTRVFGFGEAEEAWRDAQRRDRGHKVVIDFREGAP